MYGKTPPSARVVDWGERAGPLAWEQQARDHFPDEDDPAPNRWRGLVLAIVIACIVALCVRGLSRM
jgi:hypothetical protein